jgi:hypothetical protein
MSRQTEFLVDNSKLNLIKDYIFSKMNCPVIVSQIKIDGKAFYYSAKDVNELQFDFVKKLGVSYFKKSGAYWSLLLTERNYINELIYCKNLYLDEIILDVRQSPVFEFSPSIMNDEFELAGRIVLFYKGGNESFISSYNNISKYIKKLV